MSAIDLDAVRRAYAFRPPRTALLVKKHGASEVKRAASELGLLSRRDSWTDAEDAILSADRRPRGRTWSACANHARALGIRVGSDTEAAWSAEEDRAIQLGVRPPLRSWDACARRAAKIADRVVGREPHK